MCNTLVHNLDAQVWQKFMFSPIAANGTNPFVSLCSGDQDTFEGQLGYTFVVKNAESKQSRPVIVRALGRAVNPSVRLLIPLSMLCIGTAVTLTCVWVPAVFVLPGPQWQVATQSHASPVERVQSGAGSVGGCGRQFTAGRAGIRVHAASGCGDFTIRASIPLDKHGALFSPELSSGWCSSLGGGVSSGYLFRVDCIFGLPLPRLLVIQEWESSGDPWFRSGAGDIADLYDSSNITIVEDCSCRGPVAAFPEQTSGKPAGFGMVTLFLSCDEGIDGAAPSLLFLWLSRLKGSCCACVLLRRHRHTPCN